MNETLLLYYGALGLVTMLVFGIDKLRAKRRAYRISESTLLLLSLAGGCFGGLLGMYLFHHKTRKLKFSLGLPLMAVLHLILILYLTQGSLPFSLSLPAFHTLPI